jgi:hypothetical protein
MRTLWIFGLLTLLSACSSYSIRCNKHLRPINVPDHAAAAIQPSPAKSSASPVSPAVDVSGKP